MSQFTISETHLGVQVAITISIDAAQFGGTGILLVPSVNNVITPAGIALRAMARERAAQIAASTRDALWKVTVASEADSTERKEDEINSAVRQNEFRNGEIISELRSQIASLTADEKQRAAKNASRRAKAKAARK